MVWGLIYYYCPSTENGWCNIILSLAAAGVIFSHWLIIPVVSWVVIHGTMHLETHRKPMSHNVQQRHLQAIRTAPKVQLPLLVSPCSLNLLVLASQQGTALR